MFYHDKRLQYKVRVDKPNPQFARALQQALGGIEGEIRVCLQYLFQAWTYTWASFVYTDTNSSDILMKINTVLAGLLLSGSLATNTLAQQTATGSAGMAANKVGNESKAEFDRQNKQGAAAVSAITPTSAKLSEADKQLMNEVAMGGMMQLELSRVAMHKATNPQAKAMAQAEVTEQTGLAAKLKAIASAKGATLPTSPDPQTKSILGKFNQASGAAFDKLYITESGVKGHEKLNQVMTKVESSASDSNLKQLAKAVHPLVKTHLSVSRAIMTSM